MVGEMGFGAMSFGGIFGATDETTSHRTLDAALDLGVTHIDTALIYGPLISENVMGNYLQKNPSAKKRFSIATKGGFRINPRGISNEANFMRECLEGSLRRLGVDHVDLYYVHRRDQNIPIEDVTGTLADFVKEGKIGGIGFSEISPASLQRAASVHHIRAVQSEYSLWTRLPELGLVASLRKTRHRLRSILAVGARHSGQRHPRPKNLSRRLPQQHAPIQRRKLPAQHGVHRALQDLCQCAGIKPCYTRKRLGIAPRTVHHSNSGNTNGRTSC